MSSILSNENDSLLQSFDIIRISPSPEDDLNYRNDNSAISVDAQSINITDSMLSNYTPHNSLPPESATTSSSISYISQESVIANNRDSIRSVVGPTSILKTSSIGSAEAQRTSLTNSKMVSNFNDIGPEIIMGNMQISNITDYAYMSDLNSDNSKILELQNRFKDTEEILKRNNIKLRQQYAKIQKFQNEVQEAAELSTKRIEERDREILSLKATINNLEIKNENLTTQSDWSQDNFRVNLNFLETENFEFKKTISEKLAIISNMSAEMKKLQDQNIYLANNAKFGGSTNVTTADVGQLKEYAAKIKELERNASKLLAKNIELEDFKIKCQSEIHAREVLLAEAQERSRSKLTEIERLNRNLENEKKKSNELIARINVLEIHLADYKLDFEKERQERAAIAGNREEILTQLKISQKRNQQLLDELKRYNVPTKSSNNTKASPPRTAPADFQFSSQPSFICPICSKNFINYVALEHHVQLCLE